MTTTASKEKSLRAESCNILDGQLVGLVDDGPRLRVGELHEAEGNIPQVLRHRDQVAQAEGHPGRKNPRLEVVAVELVVVDRHLRKILTKRFRQEKIFFNLPFLALTPTSSLGWRCWDFYFFYMGTLNHPNYRDWSHFSFKPTTFNPRKKTLGCCWDQTRAACVASDRVIHYIMPLWQCWYRLRHPRSHSLMLSAVARFFPAIPKCLFSPS